MARVPAWVGRLKPPVGLSARLLLLTTAFVMAAALLIIAPSLASFEEGWLTDRVRLAEVASLAVEASPAGAVPERLAGELLAGAGVVSVSVQSGGVRRLLLTAPRTIGTPELVDLRRSDPAARALAPFGTLLADEGRGGRTLRVVAQPRFRSGEFVEIVVPEAPLKRELARYLLRLLVVAAATAALVGLVVYLSLNAFLVAPMQRITGSMERFRARPEDPSARLALSGRRDEIGRAEAELARMQEDLLLALHSKARLAALGEAVAKINHDLRNMLTSARMASDRLAGSGDPRVAQSLPRLERALDRAARLTEDVLAYGRSEEPPPEPRPLSLAAAARDAAEDAGLRPDGVDLAVDRSAEVTLAADPDQLDRILVNLFRNARQASEGAGRATGMVRLAATRERGQVRIEVSDDGPGVPERVRSRLFQPFGGAASPGGSGLGLAVARDLARGHGGDLELLRTGPEGTAFRLTLPAAESEGGPQYPRATPSRRGSAAPT